MSSNNPNLGETALSKAAELGVASQLSDVEDIKVDIRADPSNLIQGKLTSVAISGKGLVTKQDLRMETLEVVTNEIAINPLSAIFGNFELSHRTEAEAQVVLSEADINRALSSSYMQDKLHNLKVDVDGELLTIDVQQAAVHLPGDNKFVITADFLLKEQGESKKLSATAVPKVEESGHCLSLEILAAEGEGLTLKLIVVILEQLTALLDLRNFDIPGISLQLNQVDAQAGRLFICTKAHIKQLPSI